MIKYIILLLSLYCLPQGNFAQLNLSDFKNFNFGTTFSDTIERSKLINRFKEENKEYTILKGEFLKTYQIKFYQAPFDYYGDADYTFQYTKDTLVSFEIEYEFPEDKISNFSIFLNQIMLDFKKNSFRLQQKHLHFDNDSIVNIAKKECKRNANGHEQFLAQSLWSVNNKYISFEAEIVSGSHQFYSMEFGSRVYKDYKGSWVDVFIKLIDIKTTDLYLLTENKYFSYDPLESFRDNKLQIYGSTKIDFYNEFQKNRIKLKDENGIYKVPIKINGVLSMDFVLDLGASDVSISPDIFLVLVKSGTISQEDYIGDETYQFADGSTAKSSIINLKSITIGGKVLENVRASISKSVDAPLLLGQSAMKKLNSYKIDVENKMLLIE
jgi:aspartyl protease family protein